MLEKKRQEKIKLAAELEKVTTEILATNGRAIEPFIKVFNYSGENVTASSLGTLVGIFEVAEKSEDSAYIVNFLASVVKKEYFSNPRRGAIESFEAALHKINLALAELVKHGNVAWLGKLHGILCIFEKNNLHFSVTGEAKILLLRNGSFSEISEGLASPESALHPIKTFVEVSSGRVMLHDKIILASPEIFTLLSLQDLEKHALRMDNERFAQFLRTALVNELDMAGAIIVDAYASKPVVLPKPPKEKEHPLDTIQNVFSQTAFIPEHKSADTSVAASLAQGASAPSSEYIDSKTGHIYVQGDTPEDAPSHPHLEHVRLILQTVGHSMGTFLVSQKKFLRKGKKQSALLLTALLENSAIVNRKASRFLRKQSRKGLTSLKEQITSLRSDRQAAEPDAAATQFHYQSLPPEKISPPVRETKRVAPQQNEAPLAPATPKQTTAIPAATQNKLAAFYQKERTSTPPASFTNAPVQNSDGILVNLKKASAQMQTRLAPLWKTLSTQARSIARHTVTLWHRLPVKRQRIVLSISVLTGILIVSGIFFFTDTPQEKIAISTGEAPAAAPSDTLFSTEKNAHRFEAPLTILTGTDPIIASLLLDNESYLVTTNGVVNVREQKKYPLPSGSGNVRLTAFMSDLRLIFLYTDTNELLSWSPISHAFTKNALALPEGARVQDIGSYLTYLYVLDNATDQIYRFPRAEGGFGASSVWLRESVNFEEDAKMAVNETIFLAPNQNTVQAFFRGRFVKNLETPNTPFTTTSLFTYPGLANVYVLDQANKRVLVWNQDGSLIAQYFSETLAEAQTITVNEKTGEVLVATANTVLSFKMKLGQ